MKKLRLVPVVVLLIVVGITSCNKKMAPLEPKKSHCDQLWDELQAPEEINGVTFYTQTKIPTIPYIDTLIKYGELDATGFGLQKSLNLDGFEGMQNSYLQNGIRYVEMDNSYKNATICEAEVAKKIHHEDMGGYNGLVIQWILRPSGETIDFAILPITGNYYQLFGYYKGGFQVGNKAQNKANFVPLPVEQQITIVIFAKVGQKTAQTQEQAETPAIPSKGTSKWGSSPQPSVPGKNSGNSLNLEAP
jgi:hypothetical protein